MARLPQPGGDNGTWGDVLNDYLSQVHKANGTLKDDVVTTSAIAPNAVTAAEIKDGTISEDLLDSAAQAKLNTAATGGVVDGTITTAKLHDDAVTDAKVSPGAAIAQSKIANLTSDLGSKADAGHGHTASQISDSTSTGRNVLTAADATAARNVIGAVSKADLRLGVATRTNLVSSPDYDSAFSWVNSFTTGTPTVAQDTYTFSDGTTRKGAKVSFATLQSTLGGAIRVGRTTHNDIAVAGGQPVSVQLRVVSSIAQRLYLAVPEMTAAGAVNTYTWSDILDVPAGGDGVLFTVRIPALAATTARLQLQLWATRGVAFPAGAWLFVTGATVEQSATPLGPIFSGNDPDCAWTGAAGASTSTTAIAKPVKDSRAPELYGTPLVNGNPVSTLRDGMPTYLTENAWEPPRTRWGKPRRPWVRTSPYEGWPHGCLATDGEFIFFAYNTMQAVVSPPRGGIAKLRRQRIGNPTPSAPVTIMDRTGETPSLDTDVNCVGVAPNGDWYVIVRCGQDTFPLTTPNIVGNYLIRSTDQGATWDAGTEVLSGGSPIGVTSISETFVTAAGTTLSTGFDYTPDRMRILRNTTPDVAAGSWAKIPFNHDAGHSLLEGSFAQFKSGRIVALFRSTVYISGFVTYSDDDGLTWSTAVQTNVKVDNNPACIIYDRDSDTAEIISASRNQAKLFSTVGTVDDFSSGVFSPTSVGSLDMMNNLGHTGLGYPAALQLPDGRRLLRFMDIDPPSGTSFCIWESWGRVKS